MKKGNTYPTKRKNWKSKKIRESAVKDKAHHAVLKHAHVQKMCTQAAESRRAYHAALDRVFVKIISIQAA